MRWCSFWRTMLGHFSLLFSGMMYCLNEKCPLEAHVLESIFYKLASLFRKIMGALGVGAFLKEIHCSEWTLKFYNLASLPVLSLSSSVKMKMWSANFLITCHAFPNFLLPCLSCHSRLYSSVTVNLLKHFSETIYVRVFSQNIRNHLI